jgi:hypothetical protein
MNVQLMPITCGSRARAEKVAVRFELAQIRIRRPSRAVIRIIA